MALKRELATLQGALERRQKPPDEQVRIL
eukprot:SAG11_NODE_31627_length_290_cov_1.057592_1_plen_28_part_10